MRSKGLLILCAICISACTTTLVSADKATSIPPERFLASPEIPVNHGTIIVTRDAGRPGCYLAFFINNVLAARFDPGESAKFPIEPGEHVLRVGRDPEGRGFCSTENDYGVSRETIIRSNETKNFRLVIDGLGGFDIQRTDR